MTTIQNKNIRKLHRREWQFMCPATNASTTGSFIVTDPNEKCRFVLYVLNASLQYFYDVENDAWSSISTGAALNGTFGGGACGTHSRWSNTYTTTAGSSTSATVNSHFSEMARGATVWFRTGANAGREAVVTDMVTVFGGSTTIYFSALPSPVGVGDTFVVDTGLFWLVTAGTISTGGFRSWDPLSDVWTSKNVTGFAASLTTDGKMVTTPSDDIFSTDTASSATSTTITKTGKTWTANQWTNYQITIVSGTGMGQFKTILSNTADTITTSAWAVTPDATSVYKITGNDDFIYYLGNNSATMYRYSISGNTWTTMAPTVTRSVVPSNGMSANWIGKTGDVIWGDESNIKDGRYIYSFRGGAGGLTDRFDIAGGTAGAGAWLNGIKPLISSEVFGSGSGYAVYKNIIYIKKDNSNRFFEYNVITNSLIPYSTNIYPDGTAYVGDKLFISHIRENGEPVVSWLYSLMNGGTLLHRAMIY